MALFKIYRGDKSALPGGADGLTPTNKLHDGYAYFCVDTGELFIDVDLVGDGTGLKRVQVNALAAKYLYDGTTKIEIDDIVLNNEPLVKYDATGGETLTLNAVLVGNGTDTVKLIPADLGAFFVDVANGEPRFGVLPVAQGGIGTGTLTDGGILKGNGTDAVTSLTGTGVLFAATAGAPQFGIAPLTAGGTGGNSAKSARDNLEVYSKTEVDNALKNATTVSYPFTLVPTGWVANGSDGYVYTYANAALKCGKTGDVCPIITFTSNRDEYNKIGYATAEAGVGIKFYIDKVPTEDISIIIIDLL